MTEAPVLIDHNGYRVTPWAERKRQSLAVAEAFRALEAGKRHERITHCGTFLEFEALLRPATGERRKRRTKASFCKERLCPNCQWRRSLKLYGQVCDAVEGHLEAFPADRMLLLTLTAQSCPAGSLGASLSKLTTGYRRLSERAWFKRSVKGWFRSLEVTRNATSGLYHPHLHVLLVVPAAYFDRERDLYLTTREWVQAWQKALRVPYRPICDVRVVGARGGVRKGLAEVAKYCVKPADWLTFAGGPAAKWHAEPRIVRELAAGLRSKRLVGWGGVLREIRDARGFEDCDDDPDVIGWNELPPGWVSEGREAYNFRGRRDDVPGEFFRVRRWLA